MLGNSAWVLQCFWTTWIVGVCDLGHQGRWGYASLSLMLGDSGWVLRWFWATWFVGVDDLGHQGRGGRRVCPS